MKSALENLEHLLKTGEVQTCFYNRNKSDVYFDSYLAKRVVSLKNIKIFIEKTNFNCFDPLYKSFEFDQKISNLNLPESEEHSKSDKEIIKKNNGGFSKYRTESENTIGKRRGTTTRRTDNRKKPKFMRKN